MNLLKLDSIQNSHLDPLHQINPEDSLNQRNKLMLNQRAGLGKFSLVILEKINSNSNPNNRETSEKTNKNHKITISKYKIDLTFQTNLEDHRQNRRAILRKFLKLNR